MGGTRLTTVRQRRVLRVLCLCSGMEPVGFVCRQLGMDVQVWALEVDAEARAVAERHDPTIQHLQPYDVRWWAWQQAAEKRLQGMEIDLVVAGFPCQSLSQANARGAGLQGKSQLFFAVYDLFQRVKRVNPAVHAVFECVDSSRTHPQAFRTITETVGWEPVVLEAAEVSACRRRRAFWASFRIEPLRPVEVAVESVLDPGRTTAWTKLPTIVASGTRSWNTRRVVRDEGGREGPLRIEEMERAMGYPPGFTWAAGCSYEGRFRVIGNSFHAAVLKHVILCYIAQLAIVTRNDVRGQGRIFCENEDGPFMFQYMWDKGARRVAHRRRKHKRKKRKKRSERSEKRKEVARRTGGSSLGKRTPAPAAGGGQVRARAGQGQGANVARWRGMVGDNGELAEAEIKGVRQLLQERGFEGGVPELRVLGWERQRLKPEAPEQPGGRLSFATALADDLAVKSKARLTWKSYAAWFNCFVAFCESFGVSTSWAADRAHVYAEVLRLSVAMMHLCYSMSTIEIYVTAVCVMLRVRGVSSPREVETFRMTMEGVARELGKAKQKKPPVEPHHVAAILVSPRPAAFDELRWLQAKVVLLVGWELFVRRQDLPRLQPCDLRITQEGMHVLIRYAKNDQKGLTRAPFLQRHEDSRACPVALMEHYLRATEIRVCEGCDKVWGEPFRCLQCPSLFPSITPTGGKQDYPMPDTRVTLIIKELYKELAVQGVVTEAAAAGFSSKSLRCGGVSSAAAACVRGGVIHGHGGWFNIQSQKHYDVMKEGEAGQVSARLGAELARCMGGHEAVQGREGRNLLMVEGAPVEHGGDLGTGRNEYVIVELQKVKHERKGRRYLVLWGPCEDNDFAVDETTWEWECDLREDGVGHLVDDFNRRA